MSVFKKKLIRNREKLKPIKNYINDSNLNLELYNSKKSGCYNPKLIFKDLYKIRGENA
jgi:hypothetical protein